jgi:peptide deformylase
MDNNVLTINTESGLVQPESLDPLHLYDDYLPLLKEVMPEYTGTLPNVEMTTLVKRMRMTMKRFAGIGLSANQCNVRERVFIIGTDDFELVCINPKVVDMSDSLKKDNEGCLSYPALYLKIDRPIWILAEFTTENGETKQMKLEGLTARCYLHELDHMNGIRFIDRVGPVALKLAKQKQEKVTKKFLRMRKNDRQSNRKVNR